MPRPTTRSRVVSETHASIPEPDQLARQSSPDIEDGKSDASGLGTTRSKSTRANTSLHTGSLAHSTSTNNLRALQNARSRRDAALDRLENMTSTASDTLGDSIAPSDPSVEFGRRADATPLHGGRPQDLSGLDLDDSMFDDLNTTFDLGGPTSALRSNDTSTISATQFKRRRAGSFLSRDDGPLRPSSRAGPNTPGISSTFNIGLFKRRAREPSILGTAQKPRPQRPEPEEDQSDEDIEAGGEDDFAPEAESTPFKNTKRRSGAAVAEDKVPSPEDTNTRKRKSTDGHETRQRVSARIAENSVRQSIEKPNEADASSPLTRASQHSAQSRLATPEMDPAILAPPMSSSASEGEEEVWPPLKALAKGHAKRPVSGLRRTPVASDDGSELSSPPSLTHSPNYPDPSPPRQQLKQKPAPLASRKPVGVTTAHLTGLLPRRRKRTVRVEEEPESEVDISGLGDDDELTMHVRTRRRPAAAPRSTTGSKANQKSTRTRSARQAEETNKRLSRTYGKTQDDKENQDEQDAQSGQEEEEDDGDDTALSPIADGEENTQQLVARVGEELKDAVKKFQEVDQWTLEYEERMMSSSPCDAR